MSRSRKLADLLDANGDVKLSNLDNSTALPLAGGAMTGAITTNSTFDGVDIATRDGVLTTTTSTANAALPKAGGAMTGAITTNSTFDGRDVSTDGTKLDGIAASANNYVHPNHSGDVTSSADGATTIASNAVTQAKIADDAVGSPQIAAGGVDTTAIGTNAVTTAKIADDAVTADKLANSINTEIAANTAKVTNATHTGDVTGATALTIGNDKVITAKILDANVTTAKIADDAVTAAKLANSINTDIATGVTANTTANAALPKAGGTMTGDLILGDNVKLEVGSATGGDLQIYHDGTDSYIKDSGSGDLYIQGSSEVQIESTSGENMVRCVENGTVELFHDNSKKIETTANGVTVTGGAVGTMTTDNDGSFSMSASNNFKCTPTGNFTLTFTNIVAQSGNILLVNSGGHTVSAHANTKVDANLLATVSTAGTYLLAYFSDGTNVYMTNSAIYT